MGSPGLFASAQASLTRNTRRIDERPLVAHSYPQWQLLLLLGGPSKMSVDLEELIL